MPRRISSCVWVEGSEKEAGFWNGDASWCSPPLERCKGEGENPYRLLEGREARAGSMECMAAAAAAAAGWYRYGPLF